MSKEFSDFDKEEGKIYFNQEIKPPSKVSYFWLVIWSISFIILSYINWGNLNDLNKIKSNENYPILVIEKDQLGYYGNNYDKMRTESLVNKLLKKEEVDKYWNNCIGHCEIPETRRFKVISQSKDFINWACNERVREENYTGTKYAKWKLTMEGCELTNIDEIKKKDKEEIAELRWEKKKEIGIYLIGILINVLFILRVIKGIVTKNE
jgi:hypothetical protein